MKFAGFIAATALVAAAPFQTTDGANRTQSITDDLHRLQSVGQTTPEPPESQVTIGDPAPDFSFESHDHRWMRLKDMLAQGNVLLVFGADDADLAALQAERDALLDRGIVPVAVLDRGDGATWSTVQKLKITYSLLSDPRSVIGAQFNVLNPSTHHPDDAWFVVDRKGVVRGLKRNSLPSTGYVAVATVALGLPNQGISLPASAK